jgi:SAM-dependent methyltransferase
MSGRAAALSNPFPRLSARHRVAEIMDDPALDPARHRRALKALERINRVSLTAPRLWSEIARLARDGVRPVRVLDVACGGGDVLLDLERRARRAGVDVELHGCDRSAVALDRARARAAGRASCTFHECDVLSEPFPTAGHLVTSSLFLHHLSAEAAIHLLRAMGRAAECVLVVQDLRRTLAGYALAWLGLHTLTLSDVARVDGLVSVRAAFTMAEAESLAREAGLGGAVVRRCWPQRFLLRWARP